MLQGPRRNRILHTSSTLNVPSVLKVCRNVVLVILSGLLAQWYKLWHTESIQQCVCWVLQRGLSGEVLAVVLHGVLGRQNKWCEAGQRLCQFQERMLQEFFAAAPFFYIHLQTPSQEVTENRRQLLRTL